MNNLYSTNIESTEYKTLQFYYTTAEIEELEFTGEYPFEPCLIDEYEIEKSEKAKKIMIINGHPVVLKEEIPPGAELPDRNSKFYKTLYGE